MSFANPGYQKKEDDEELQGCQPLRPLEAAAAVAEEPTRAAAAAAVVLSQLVNSS